jgi:N utilization substance protein B
MAGAAYMLKDAKEPSGDGEHLSRRDIRALAFHLLYAVDRSDYTTTVEETVELFTKWYGITISADSYAVILAQGAVHDKDQLDAAIKPLLQNWRIERLGCCTRLILRLALWELQSTGPRERRIVINEAIELAKSFAEKDAYKFVNGILDSVGRTEDRTQPAPQVPDAE